MKPPFLMGLQGATMGPPKEQVEDPLGQMDTLQMVLFKTFLIIKAPFKALFAIPKRFQAMLMRFRTTLSIKDPKMDMS